MWRSIVAVVAGYVLAALGIGLLRGTTIFVLRHFGAGGDDWTALSYRVLKLVYTLASAIAGGYLAAAAAAHKPRWHAFAVSTVLAGAYLISHNKYAAQPVWYFNSLCGLAVVGPVIGGELEHRRGARRVEQESRAYRAAKVLLGGFLIGATIVNRLSPSSDLPLPNNAAAGPGMLAGEIVVCALGAWLVYAGLREEQ
jgi:hypothetical protein